MNTNKSESSIISKILRNSVLILLLIIFISIVYNFRNRQEKTAVALMSDAVASKELSGVFIRDEEVRLYSGSGILSYNVADGGKLGNGTVIAEVYPDDKQIARYPQKDTEPRHYRVSTALHTLRKHRGELQEPHLQPRYPRL